MSDEGYKSSQGNVGNSASPNGVRTLTEEGQNIELASSNEGNLFEDSYLFKSTA